MFQKQNNFINCPSCNSLLISEEYLNHSCFIVKNIFIDNKIIWVSDGKDWYRYYGLPPRNQHPFKTPDDSTEPKIINFQLESSN